MGIADFTRQLAKEAITSQVDELIDPQRRPDAAAPSPDSMALAIVAQLQAMQNALKEDQELLVSCAAGGETIRVFEIFAPSPRLLVLTGAGISAESGIPTFRGSDGYWTIGSKNYRPQELATFAAFSRDPEIIWQWYLQRRAGCHAAQPNPGHAAVVALERMAQDQGGPLGMQQRVEFGEEARTKFRGAAVDHLLMRAGTLREKNPQELDRRLAGQTEGRQ